MPANGVLRVRANNGKNGCSGPGLINVKITLCLGPCSLRYESITGGLARTLLSWVRVASVRMKVSTSQLAGETHHVTRLGPNTPRIAIPPGSICLGPTLWVTPPRPACCR
jgi:hypothetical protein